MVILIPKLQKDDVDKLAFNYEKVAGIWMPYEVVLIDGSIQHGPFTSSSHFGACAESVQFNKDQKFIPVIWNSSINFLLKNEEAGTLRMGAKCKFQQ